MKEYAEIYKNRVVGIHPRDDDRPAEFQPPRFAVRIDELNPKPSVGWEYRDEEFFDTPAPIPPPPPVNDRRLLEDIQAKVERILDIIDRRPGP